MNAVTQVSAPPPESLPPAESLLNFVARAVADPGIDVAKLQVLLDMQRQIVADDAKLAYNRAMAAAQADMLPVVRDATNEQTSSRYARLETIDSAIRPIYTGHGFCLEFNSEPTDGPKERIICEVSHTAGHTKRYQLDAPPDTAGPRGTSNKTPLHGLGSTVTYLRRYLVCMVFNVVLKGEDTDGNSSGRLDRERQQRQQDSGQISAIQVEDLWKLMDDGRIREAVVIEKMCPGLRSITQLPVTEFQRVRGALVSRLNALEQRAAAERAAAARQATGGDAR